MDAFTRNIRSTTFIYFLIFIGGLDSVDMILEVVPDLTVVSERYFKTFIAYATGIHPRRVGES